MSESTTEHRRDSPETVRLAVITVSDTRTIETDTGGATAIELAEMAGHTVVDRQIIPDDPVLMTDIIKTLVSRTDVDCILMTGGTGISSRDQTFETVTSLLTKQLPGYGELFRSLSFPEIGAAAMLSRAVGGVVHDTLLLTMPGSQAAVRLAMHTLILPEIGHLLRETRR